MISRHRYLVSSSSPSEDQALPTTRPFLDAELANAIETLEESTSITRSQTDVLKRQCDILREERKEAELADEKRAKTLKLINERHARETQHVEGLVCTYFIPSVTHSSPFQSGKFMGGSSDLCWD